MWTLQVIEPYRKEEEAQEALRSLEKQPGFLGGTYTDNLDGEGFYVQAFFRSSAPGHRKENDFPYPMEHLPNGTKHVFIPHDLKQWYGIKK